MTTAAKLTWSRSEAFEMLEIEGSPARSWTIVWPGAVIVEPRSEGLRQGDGSPLPRGTALVAPPDAAHVQVSALPGASLRIFFANPPVTRGPRMRRIAQPAARTTSAEGADLFLEALTYLEDGAHRLPFAPRWVTDAEARLRDDLARQMSLADLGALAGAERSHLCRTFAKVFGLTPWRYRLHLRVSHARLLLARGFDCTESAHAVGFCDQSHFTRSFKALLGTTPTAYVKSCGFVLRHAAARAA